MDIQELKKMKKEAGLTNREIAELSNIPFSTVNKIFSGATENPRYSTLLAIEEVIKTKTRIPFTYDSSSQEMIFARDAGAAHYQFHARNYQERDLAGLTEGTLAELIKKKLFMFSAPSRQHQFIVSQLLFQISMHIYVNKGRCQVYPAPFDVRLFGDDSVIVQPDISVICNLDILTERGCDGAPDWVIEVVSKNNASHDYVTKLMQYQKAGVREYWIVDPEEQAIHVYNFEDPSKSESYSIADDIPSGIFGGLITKVEG